MPKVGNRAFPYTPQGIADAKAEARATGQPVKARKTYTQAAVDSLSRGGADAEGAAEKGDSPAEDKAETKKSLGGSGVTINDAIKHPGALTAKAKAANMTVDAFASAHQHDSDETGKQARFYLSVLKKAKK